MHFDWINNKNIAGSRRKPVQGAGSWQPTQLTKMGAVIYWELCETLRFSLVDDA